MRPASMTPERPFAHLELDELVAAVTAVADAGDLESVALGGAWQERATALVAEAELRLAEAGR